MCTRYPSRPNQIGLSTVRLLFRQENRLTLGGVDVLYLAPRIDIKPYLPDFDIRTEDVHVGGYETQSKEQGPINFLSRLSSAGSIVFD
ncbi:MAG: TrmO family methyltransferase [Bacteroidota bacterium]